MENAFKIMLAMLSLALPSCASYSDAPDIEAIQRDAIESASVEAENHFE